MNIDKFKQQHVDILGNIATLRKLTQAGVAQNAPDIARLVVAMSSTIKLHLAVEDKVLYPALQNGQNVAMARMGKQFQEEMSVIARTYEGFAQRWNTAHSLQHHEDDFRADANIVLRTLHERMQRENRDFYPRIEAL